MALGKNEHVVLIQDAMVNRHQDVQRGKVPADMPYPTLVVHPEETFSGRPDSVA